MNLTYHGKTKESCEWVIKNYKNNELYFDSITIQKWIKDSEEWMKINVIQS